MKYDIICFSHLRWNFVFQRPQHLMTRFAKQHRVLFIEEPLFDAGEEAYYDAYKDDQAEIFIITPHLPEGLEKSELQSQQKALLATMFRSFSVENYLIWHYSPMSFGISADLSPLYRVYDCMDELSNFLNSPPDLKEMEAALLWKANIVFTGGNSLYHAKKHFHDNIYSFPSSIDKDHFSLAREFRSSTTEEPQDQGQIGRPRIGFFGVIDERLNIGMLAELAVMRPDWQFVLIGPVVKIDPASLPRQDNIHYLGMKPYKELPKYLAGWDIAMMPFALNASTEFISPTKTPEYLAGGVQVIAPSIRDVVTPYSDLGLVAIADTAEQFIRAAERMLQAGPTEGWLRKVDTFLNEMSWERTVADMARLIDAGIQQSSISIKKNINAYV